MKKENRLFELIVAVIKGTIKRKGLNIDSTHIKQIIGKDAERFNILFPVSPKITTVEHTELVRELERRLIHKEKPK